MTDIIRCCIDRPRLAIPPHAREMAAERAKLWLPGQTLKIAFRGGTPRQRSAVMLAASIWQKYANVKFAQVSGGASHLRCAFGAGGSWSYVGRECLSIPADEPTCNMGWPNDPGRDLHELGHALGLIHEHQSPAAEIPWNKEAIYALLGGSPNFWTRDEVDEQVFARYDKATITNSAYDVHSVMHYWFPPEYVTKPLGISGPNQSLSTVDIATIARLYPRKGAA